LKTLARVLATWFFCGYAPVAPGTVGSAAAILIAWVVYTYASQPAIAFGFFAAVLAIPGIWAAGVTAREINSKDPGIVVVDEVVGQWITLAGATELNWHSWLLAFCLFRIFDIWKPPPVRQLEKLPGGFGIVADDAMAGVYGALVLFAAGRFHLY
jgi:phosphatidylglycerophosphatase A